MFKVYCSLLITCFFTVLAFGQPSSPTDIEIKKIIPPTPNAASLGSYGNVPIGLYTGQPNVNFPLYEIQYNDIVVPINLSYNYSGLKVEEYPSWVGTGWTLTGTGVISRQVRGLPDETTAGYNGSERNGLKTVDFINSGGNVSEFSQFLNGVRGGDKDAEPDIFVLSMPGHSAKFFFDETQCNTTLKQAIVIPHQKLEIVGHFNYELPYNIRMGIIEKFVVTDQKGIIYTFDITEKAAGVEPGDQEADFASSWYLSKIETPNNNVVTYEYADRILDMPATVFERRYIPIIDGGGPVNPGDAYSLTYNYTSTNEKILKRIRFRDGVIDFIEGDERLDWAFSYLSNKASEKPRSLSRMKVTIGGKVVKEIKFTYSYFGNDARLRMDSFQEMNGIEVKQPYVFSYKDGLFPTIGQESSLFHQDHWGYYMGSTSNGDLINTLIPPFSQSFQKPDGSLLIINVPGNSRTPNLNYSSAGLLEEITYPTGGSTQFEYESNYYRGSTQSQFNLCSGDFQFVAKSSVSFSWGNPGDTKEFTVTNPTCIKFEYSLDVPCIDGEAGVRIDEMGGRPIMYHIVQNKMAGMDYSDYGPDEGDVFTLEPGTYALTAWGINENTCGSPTEATITLNQIFQSPSGYANLRAGGARIKKTRDCSDDQNCIIKYYDYTDPDEITQSSGVLINDPAYFYLQSVIWDQNFTPTYIGSSQSSIPIASTMGGIIGYKSVTVTDDDLQANGKTIYKFSSAAEYPDEGSVDYPFPPRISNDWKRGAQLYRKDFSDTQIISNLIDGYCEVPTYNRQVGIKTKKLSDYKSGEYNVTLNDFDFVPYSISTGWTNLCSRNHLEYSYVNGAQQEMISEKDFFYENPIHQQVTRIETTNSKGEQLKSLIKYVEDVASLDGLTPEERVGIQAHPNKLAIIEQQQFNGASVVSTTRNIYNGPKLSKVQFATGTNQLEDYVNYNSYDNYNNVLNYTTRSGENKSYLWDNNGMFPIAEATNANHSDIYFTSFEINGVPFVDSNGNNLAISGTSVANSGSFSFPGSFQPADPSNTLMSYWYWQNNQWNFSGEIPYSNTITTAASRLDEIRAFPKGAFLTTLTNEPGIGTTSVTDSNNQSLHYEYDLLGRLLLVRDHNGNILKEYKYHYQGQN
ncbi:MAG: RHS repeat protein [Cyclobacteriaceae bacterium]|nr:RHS repeat protein [Cyclobacteriaceae bacterium]